MRHSSFALCCLQCVFVEYCLVFEENSVDEKSQSVRYRRWLLLEKLEVSLAVLTFYKIIFSGFGEHARGFSAMKKKMFLSFF